MDLQLSVWRGERTDKPPLTLTCPLTEEQKSWLPECDLKEIHFDSAKMFSSGLRSVLTAVNGGYGAVPSTRANMGCGVVPSLFGRQQRLFEDKMPWLLDHVKKEEIKENYDFGIGDSAEFAAAMEHMEYMTEKLRASGFAGRVFVYPLDLQGAVDTAHLIYGDDFFYGLYDDGPFIHHLLRVSCEAINYAMDECFKRIDHSGKYIAHYNHLILPREKGGVKISEDTTTLLSPHLIDEFALPYLHNLLEHFGGGYVHYCGNNDHLTDVLYDEPLARAINFGNPERHYMTAVIKKCRDTGSVYVGSIEKKDGEPLFDYFVRILEPAYNKDSGVFHIIPEYTCDLSERVYVIGEFDRAAEHVMDPA